MKIPKNDINANKIFKFFSKKYLIGETGLISAVCISSLKVKNVKPFSLMIVAPSGQMKSSIIKDIIKIFNEDIFLLSSRFTPYGVSTKVNHHELNNKTWIINDMVRTFDGISQTKIAEMVGFMAELMSEGKADSSTALSTSLEAKMNLIGCIPNIKYKEIRELFLSSTFSERILQFQYIIKKTEIRKKSKKKLKWENGLIKLNNHDVMLPRKYKKYLYELSDKLTKIAHYEKESMRTDEIVLSFLSGYALLNGRNKIRKSDLKIFEHLLQFFRRVV